MAPWLLLGACDDPATSEGATDSPDVVGVDTTPCPDQRLQADGGCCAVGSLYNYLTDSCDSVGPPECAAVMASDPSACQPLWCGDWLDDDGAACGKDLDPCWLKGRTCTADELAAGLGCKAGWWPKPGAASPCVQVGTGPTLAGPLTGKEPQEYGLPPIAPLPKLVTPSWCWDHRDAKGQPCEPGPPDCVQVPRRCAEGGADAGCMAGWWSPTGEPGKCVLAGVPWVCPPGFVGDPQHKDSVPGLPACVPDMADCLEGKWGGIKGPKVRYVDAAAQPGGVGTQTAPYNALAVAVAKSPPGATLAVAAGEYPGTVVITKPIRIVGRCAALVSVVAPPKVAAIGVGGKPSAMPVRIERLRITGEGSGLGVLGNLHVQGKRLFFDRPMFRGVEVQNAGGNLALEDSVIHGVRATKEADGSGMGLVAWLGGTASLTRVRISKCILRGVTVESVGSQLDASEIIIDGTARSPTNGKSGDAIAGGAGVSIRLRGALVSHSARGGLMIRGDGASMWVGGLAVDHTGETQGGAFASAMDVALGAQMTVAGASAQNLQGALATATNNDSMFRVGGLYAADVSVNPQTGGAIQAIATAHVAVFGSRIQRVHGPAITAGHDGTDLLVADTQVVDCDETPGDPVKVAGILVIQGAHARIVSSRLSSNTRWGLMVGEKGTRVEVDKLLIDRTRLSTIDSGLEREAAGIRIFNGSRLLLRDVRISQSTYSSLQVYNSSKVVASGLLLDHGHPALIGVGVDGEYKVIFRSQGLLVRNAARLDIAGGRSRRMVSIDSNVLEQGSVLDAAGLLVDSVLRDESLRGFGLGFLVEDGGRIRCSACRQVANRSSSVLARLGGRVELRGSVIRATQGDSYKQTAFEGQVLQMADAVVGRDNGHLDVQDCLLTGNARSGLMVTLGGTAVLRGNAITDNGYGIVRQGEATLESMGNGIWNNSIANMASEQGLVVPSAPSILKD